MKKEWIEEAYKQAVEHGFHEEEYNDEHWLMLIICEVSEAIEADRKGTQASPKLFEKHIKTFGNEGRTYQMSYRRYIKGSREEELADVCIRIFDLAGLRGIELQEITDEDYNIWNKHFGKGYSFTECAYSLCYALSRVVKLQMKLQAALIFVYALAAHLHIDIEWHIDAKMRYNRLRSYRHGKRY